MKKEILNQKTDAVMLMISANNNMGKHTLIEDCFHMYNANTIESFNRTLDNCNCDLFRFADQLNDKDKITFINYVLENYKPEQKTIQK